MCAEWCGTLAEWFTGCGTVVVAIVAICQNKKLRAQNERLMNIEQSELLSSNSCMPLLEEMIVKADPPDVIALDKHCEQVLASGVAAGLDHYPGITMEMTFSETEKLESHPVYVYIERVSISPTKESQKQSGIKEFSNTREYKYTVVADQRNQFKFEITLLMDKDERAASCLINSVSNDSVWIEVELSMISKAGVETNCKCRSFLTTYGYSKNHNTNSGPYNYFISRDIKDKYGAPMLFWYSSKKINLDQLDILKLSESGNSKSDTSDMM